MAETPVFKNTYVIDMKQLSAHPLTWTPNGRVELPIETKNGIAPTDPNEKKHGFDERHANRMIKQYPVLFPIVNKTARTVIEYLDSTGRPVLALYPSNDIDFYRDNRHQDLTPAALADLYTVCQEYKKFINGAMGALRDRAK